MSPERLSNLEQRKIYDPILRILHASNGLAILLLLATGWGAELFDQGAARQQVWIIHVYAGYVLIVGLVARIAWGIIGPPHARFSDMWHPASWLRALQQLKKFHLPTMSMRFGHDEFASAAYLLIYVSIFVMSLTGLALSAIEYDMGPLAPQLFDDVWLLDYFEEPHEIITNVIAAFIVIHLAMLILHQVKDKIPVAQSMFSGNQYRPASHPLKK